MALSSLPGRRPLLPVLMLLTALVSLLGGCARDRPQPAKLEAVSPQIDRSPASASAAPPLIA
jgi:hypothetical protein